MRPAKEAKAAAAGGLKQGEGQGWYAEQRLVRQELFF